MRTALAAKARLLESIGPMLGRPHVDTLEDSRHSNIKELRFDAADGAWCVAFAFDTARQAVVLVAGDKSGGSEARFYRSLIATVDKRFDDHLERQKKLLLARRINQDLERTLPSTRSWRLPVPPLPDFPIRTA